MKYKFFMMSFFFILLFSNAAFCEEKELYDEEKMMSIIKYKYSDIKRFDDLILAINIFQNEYLAVSKSRYDLKVWNSTYKYVERIFLIDTLNKYIDDQPDLVIPLLISFYQYSGAADSEYLSEYLFSSFEKNPSIFIKNVNRTNIFRFLSEDFKNDKFLNLIYESITTPMSDEYYEYDYKKDIASRIKNIKIDNDNDFYNYLKLKWGLN